MDGSKNVIKTLREQKGMSQSELAKKIGVTKAAVSYYEKGARMPQDRTVIKLAAALNVPVGELYNEMSNFYHSNTANDTPSSRIILYNNILAGQSALSAGEIRGYISSIYSYDGDTHFALRIHGDKMSGSCLPDNSIAIIKKQSYIEDGQIAVIRVNDGDGIIGHLYHDKKKLIIKFSDGKTKDLNIDLLNNHVDIVGRAVGYQGEFK